MFRCLSVNLNSSQVGKTPVAASATLQPPSSSRCSYGITFKILRCLVILLLWLFARFSENVTSDL